MYSRSQLLLRDPSTALGPSTRGYSSKRVDEGSELKAPHDTSTSVSQCFVALDPCYQYVFALQSLVRQGARTLMNRAGFQAAIPDGPPSHLLQPSIRDYFVEWFASFGSPWNLEARSILVKYVLSAFHDVFREGDKPRVEKAVLAHLQTLRKAYMVSKSPHDRKILAAKQKRHRRKREV